MQRESNCKHSYVKSSCRKSPVNNRDETYAQGSNTPTLQDKNSACSVFLKKSSSLGEFCKGWVFPGPKMASMCGRKVKPQKRRSFQHPYVCMERPKMRWKHGRIHQQKYLPEAWTDQLWWLAAFWEKRRTSEFLPGHNIKKSLSIRALIFLWKLSRFIHFSSWEVGHILCYSIKTYCKAL